ncbi:thioesterase, FlK family [Saccharopolyspora griseoalba]|uniref:Fluoroacetyl-CoA-specific thioesterase-like domain-containing protein n=1 Tax=Saccharopolyspora griseoalba TaxID=1431848 RepID=A0ABW2LPC5_9PSEU
MTTAKTADFEQDRVRTGLRTIGTEHTVPRILPGSLLASRGEPVWATASLIAMLEDATWELIAPDVPEEFAMLGCGGTYEHAAPTLAGQRVRIELERGGHPLSGRRTWTARAVNADTGEQAGVLRHQVAVVDRERFYRRLGR